MSEHDGQIAQCVILVLSNLFSLVLLFLLTRQLFLNYAEDRKDKKAEEAAAKAVRESHGYTVTKP